VGNFRNFAVWVIIAMLMFALFNLFQQPGQQTRSSEKSYSDFIADVQSGQIKSVTIAGDQITGMTSDSQKFRTTAPADPNLITILRDKNVNIRAEAAQSEGGFSSFLLSWFPMLLLHRACGFSSCARCRAAVPAGPWASESPRPSC
jgi:cell division protease FtsH